MKLGLGLVSVWGRVWVWVKARVRVRAWVTATARATEARLQLLVRGAVLEVAADAHLA